MRSQPIPEGLELYDLDEVTQTFDPLVVELLISGMTIEDAKKTVSGDTTAVENNIADEEVAIEDNSFVPFK